jgi:Fe-S-cluster containining protein
VNPPVDDGLEKLERQAARGSLHTHGSVDRLVRRIERLERYATGLAELLVDHGVLPPDLVDTAMPSRDEAAWPSVALRQDPDGADVIPVEVDCAARMHVCHAVCCTLRFALSADEVEAGHARWDLGDPYFIRQEADHLCTHNDRETGSCTIYEHRPAICRRYSCAGDERIWLDFDEMVLNHEWIATRLRVPDGNRVRPPRMDDGPSTKVQIRRGPRL